MTIRTKPGVARRVLSPIIALGTAAMPLAGLALAALGASPALAEASEVLMSTASSSGLAEAHSPAGLQADHDEPEYESIGSGMASYYGPELKGNRTASGERFDPSALTAAHRTLPLGSTVKVTNKRTGDSVLVRINDRGPFHGNRLIDLSEAAARRIGIKAAGSGVVDIAVLTA